MTWQSDFSFPWLSSADYPKHNPWTNKGFLPRTSVLTWSLLMPKERRAPPWTSLTFTAWINCSCVRVKDLHTVAKKGGFLCLLVPPVVANQACKREELASFYCGAQTLRITQGSKSRSYKFLSINTDKHWSTQNLCRHSKRVKGGWQTQN